MRCSGIGMKYLNHEGTENRTGLSEIGPFFGRATDLPHYTHNSTTAKTNHYQINQ